MVHSDLLSVTLAIHSDAGVCCSRLLRSTKSVPLLGGWMEFTYTRGGDLLGIVVLPLDLHLVNVGSIPQGPGV